MVAKFLREWEPVTWVDLDGDINHIWWSACLSLCHNAKVVTDL